MAEQRIALVTGGTGGIGTEICKHLAKQGAKVIAGYNKGGSDVQAKAWQKEQAEAGFEFGIAYADVSNFESCAVLVEEIEKNYGPIDIVVNNAGITQDSVLKKMDAFQWESVMRINLDSIFNVTRQVINGMIERQFGRIICISSVNGQKGQFGQTNYSTAKSGMYGFVKSLAQEVANKGITANCISPGYVGTAMVKKIAQPILDKIVQQIPLGRLAEPSEIARVAAFLSSDDSGYITGANIPVNGGLHMY
ncbi:MAG: acetoacetyl-CoA reductase [Gammaproteobacteria bacterium]